MLAACGNGEVSVDPAPQGEDPACARAQSALPQTVFDQPRTTLSPTSAGTAAWGSGERAIVWRCGVALPSSYTQTSELIVVNGVDWLPEQWEGGYRFTTIGRVVNAELTVPHGYGPEAGALTDLEPAARAIPRR